MPPKVLFTKEEITDAAVRVVRKKGSSALTARSLAAELGCSVKPIFGAFKNMDEVRSEVIKASEKIYRDRLAQAEKDGKNPPYKSAGLAYIKFAKEEKELFKLLFMRSRSEEDDIEPEETAGLLSLIRKSTGLDEKEAFLFHLETWVFVHGFATMIATEYLEWDDDFLSRALSDCYFGLKTRLGDTKKDGNIPENR